MGIRSLGRNLAVLGTFILLLTFFGTDDVSARTLVVESGHAHNCALNDEDEVHCWGWNFFGQTGRDLVDRRTPKPWKIALPEGRVEQIAVGGQNSCAVVEGELYCWGKNDFGQLANDSKQHSWTPVKIELPGRIGQVDIGSNHMCAIVDSGVMCWGWNFSCELGQLGCVGGNENPERMNHRPRWVHSLGRDAGVTYIDSSYDQNCVIKNGGAYCWGAPYGGKLGDGVRRIEAQPTPIAVIGMQNDVTEISSGQFATCAIKRGKVYCWGRKLYIGFDDMHGVQLTATRMPLLRGNNYSNIMNYENHMCVLQGTRPLCWGNGAMGALGHGENEFSYEPVQPVGIRSATQLSVGGSSTCTLTDNGTYCMGWNAFCQGGTGQCNGGNLVPQKVMFLP